MSTSNSLKEIESTLSSLMGLVFDLIEHEGDECRILLRKSDAAEPFAVIKLRGCFYFKDFGAINCAFNGFRVIDLGVKLHNMAEKNGKAPTSFRELHLWTDVQNISKYGNYKFTGITAAYETIDVSYDKGSFFK